jgi:hypothetical protein
MELSPQLITQFGLMNKISTGNSFLDMLLCMLVPWLLQHLVPWLQSYMQAWFAAKPTSSYTRNITHTIEVGGLSVQSSWS